MAEPKDDKTTLSQDTIERARQAGRPRASLVVYHRDQVKLMPLGDEAELVVGRAWPADVVIADPSLSRRHAKFSRVSEGVRVEDLGSTNGTHHRGERIRTTILGPGESVTLGTVTVSVNLAALSAALLEGIDTYEQFFARLGEELLRARTFRRPLALLMIRAIGGEDNHVSRWVPRVRNTLRPVDRVALYGDAAVFIALVETDRERARTVASALVEGDRLGEPLLLSGIALYGARAGELIDTARQLCRRAQPDRRVMIEGDDTTTASTPESAVFVSPKMVELRRIVERVATSSIPVLVQGETGSGKEVIARSIHRASQRAHGPIRSVNCGAMPANLIESQLFGHERGAFTGAERTTPGLFEQASGGTLFLDEIGELSPAAQAALLRVIETGRLMRVGGTEEIAVDVRLVAATHRDLEEMVRDGRFRQDLLYRLNTMTIWVPPLRERPEDLVALMDRFLEEAGPESAGQVRRIDPSAREILMGYAWPGNVRELRNVIDRAAVVCTSDAIRPEDLPEHMRAPAIAPQLATDEDIGLEPSDDAFKDRVRAYETKLILDALRASGGNQTAAATLLRMPLRTLVHKLRSYGIKKSFDTDE
ncbi:MAG: sigma 54-interacting transcriptional regulator [Sandaracinaceae bacterium]